MARFLIEVPHEEETVACARVIEIFLKTGSHFLTHTDRGCMDGEHKAWLIVDVDNKEDARRILPPAFRSQTRIVGLNKFSLEQIDEILARHRQPQKGDARMRSGTVDPASRTLPAERIRDFRSFRRPFRFRHGAEGDSTGAITRSDICSREAPNISWRGWDWHLFTAGILSVSDIPPR